MAEESSTTTTTAVKSSGSVKIAVEEYNDLMRRANEPKQIYNPVYTTVEKTPEMAAKDLVHAGAFCMGGGGALFILGALSFLSGRRQLKGL